MNEDQQAEMAKLAAKCDGRPKPDDVLQWATPADNPLHSLFEWDNAIAGHQHRLDQARRILRIVVIKMPVQNRLIEIRRYHEDPGKPEVEQGYIDIQLAKDDRGLSLALVLQELARSIASVSRACDLIDALDVSCDLRDVLDEMTEIRDDLRGLVARPRARAHA